MRTSPVLPIIGAVALAGRVLAGDAEPSTDNPSGVVYEANLPDKPFFPGADIEGNVKGSITAIAREDGKGVNFRVMFENLPKSGGPFGKSHLGLCPRGLNLVPSPRREIRSRNKKVPVSDHSCRLPHPQGCGC